MLKVRLVNKKEKDIINQVVQIHLDTFRGFFLTFMGKGFLKQMYGAYCSHEPSRLLVSFNEDGMVAGFLAYSTDVSGLYKYMIKRRLIPFAWYSLGAFCRNPKIFIRLIRAFLKPSESKREEKYVKLTSIGVDPNIKSKGIGSEMISEMKKMIDFEKYAYISLETDAEGNDNVNKFYVKNGFVLADTYQTNEGRKMNEYRYKGNL